MTTIKTARSGEVYNSLSLAIKKLDSYNFKSGEIFSVFYRSQDSKVNALSAIGLGNGKYKIITTVPYPIVTIKESDPGIGERDGIVWKDTNDMWYFGDDPVSSEFLAKDTNSNYLSITENGPKELGDTYTNSELQDRITETLEKVQSDWSETDNTSPKYISNKPQDLSDFIEDILYTIIEDEPGIYSLKKNGTHVSVPVVVPPDNSIASAQLIYTDNFYLEFVFESGEVLDTPLYMISKAFVQGPGIEIIENRLNVKTELLDENNRLSIREASIDNPGYMSSSDKIKLDKLYDSTLLSAEKLQSGEIEPRDSIYTSGIQGTEADIINSEAQITSALRLTGGDDANLIYTGKARLLELYGDDVRTDAIISEANDFVPKNDIFPGFILEDTTIDQKTGEISYKGGKTTVFFYVLDRYRYIIDPPFPDITVGVCNEIPELGRYVYNVGTDVPEYLVEPGYHIMALSVEGDIKLIRKIKVFLKDYNLNIYGNSILDLKLPDTNTNGAVGIDPIYDRWFSRGDTLYFEQKFGHIEITDWGEEKYDEEQHYEYYEIYVSDIKPGTQYIKGIQGVWATEDKTVRTLDNMNIGNLYYELQEPRIFNLNTPAVYNVWKYGTECFALMKPNYYVPRQDIKTAGIRYKIQYPNDLDSIFPDIPTALNDLEYLNYPDYEMSDLSENMVSAITIKEYIDNKIIINSSDIIDLSYYDIHGNIKDTNETANCYVIRKPGNYKIPLVYGNGVKYGQPNINSYKISGVDSFYNYLGDIITQPYIPHDEYTGSRIWSEGGGPSTYKPSITNISVQWDLDSNTGYMYFKVNSIPFLGGNEILALKDSNNRIVWSWHMWLTSDDLTPLDFWNNRQILPENLGNTWFSGNRISGKVGGRSLYYQWGRKDPFPKTGSVQTSSNYTIANTIQNPRVFYNTTSYVNNYNSWNTYPGQINSYGYYKSIYDPCPSEYYVPEIDVFKYFTTTGTSSTDPSEFKVVENYSNGWNFITNEYDNVDLFDAHGNRLWNTGAISNDNSPSSALGMYWCNKYMYFDFSSSSIYFDDGSNYLGTGRYIRPVKE